MLEKYEFEEGWPWERRPVRPRAILPVWRREDTEQARLWHPWENTRDKKRRRWRSILRGGQYEARAFGVAGGMLFGDFFGDLPSAGQTNCIRRWKRGLRNVSSVVFLHFIVEIGVYVSEVGSERRTEHTRLSAVAMRTCGRCEGTK